LFERDVKLGFKNSVASVVRIFSVALCGNKNIVIIFPIKRKHIIVKNVGQIEEESFEDLGTAI